jgi:hypothetical protein
MWILILGVVLAGMSILLFAMMSMAQSEERLAREAEREFESIASGAVYGKSLLARASVGNVESKDTARAQSESGKLRSGDGDRNHEQEEEALA